MSETQETAPPKQHRHRRRRRRGRVFGLWMVLTAGFLAAFLGVMLLALWQKPVTLPGWVTEQIENQINANLPQGRVTLDRLDVTMAGTGIPHVTLRNLAIFDPSGSEVARLNALGAAFSLRRLFEGQLVPSSLSLSGAEITIRRRANGQFDLSFGGGAGTSGTLAGVLDAIDKAFSTEPLAEVATVSAGDLTLSLEDARSGRIWTATDGSLTLEQTPDSIDFTVKFDVFNGTETLAETAMTFTTEKGSPRAAFSARFTNAAAGDIAAQSPILAFLGLLDAPISGAVRFQIGGDAKLESFAGTLEIGQGRLRTEGVERPIQVDRGKAYFTFDPHRNRISFSDLSLASDAGSVNLTGSAYLSDLRPDGFPNALVAQLFLASISTTPNSLFPEAMTFSRGLADLRVRLSPLTLELGQLVLHDGASDYRLSGRAAFSAAGPDLALDATVNHLALDQISRLWPTEFRRKTRDWLAENVTRGEVSDVTMALRRKPQEPDRSVIGFRFSDASVLYMKGMPPITAAAGYVSIVDHRFTMTADSGVIVPPEGGTIDIAGSSMVIPDTRVKPPPSQINLALRGPVHALLSLIDQPPLSVLAKAGRKADLAEGSGAVAARIEVTLADKVRPQDIAYAASGVMTGVTSDVIVPGKRASADRLELSATDKQVTVSGEARLDGLPVSGAWTQVTGEPVSHLAGQAELSQTFLDTFGIGLPKGSVAGASTAEIAIDLPRAAPARFDLQSDLKGLTLRLPALNWSKGPGSAGRLAARGTLGEAPDVEFLSFEGGGLSTTGRITLAPGGGLVEARFDRVSLGGWLDAPITLTAPETPGGTPGIRVEGGTLDFRKATLGAEKAAGPGGGPLAVALDRLIMAEGIELDGFSGDFDTRGGLSGRFTARLNGGGRISGTVVQQDHGTALRVVSENAGDVLTDAKVAKHIRGGAMELILVPTDARGTYDGRVTASNLRVKGTPALADLLDAVSIVGLLNQLNGDGLVFDTARADFILTPDQIDFTKASAVGASLGITLEGTYRLADGALAMKGVFSPVYMVNAIGQIFSKPGEGLFGFNYSVSGTAEAPKVKVNPLSILTPGMFREIFRAPPPETAPAQE